MVVWVIETGDYEQRGIVDVADSVDAAVEAVKASYKPPYRVQWEDVVLEKEKYPQLQDSDVYLLIGHFAEVLGFSTHHSATFTMTPYKVSS